MSNPTELPDLNKLEREALDIKYNNHWKVFATNPDTILALIALARRAKPEDEERQAVAIYQVLSHDGGDWYDVEKSQWENARVDMRRVLNKEQCRAAQQADMPSLRYNAELVKQGIRDAVAQHAESGAQPCKHKDNTECLVCDTCGSVNAGNGWQALAAQSQDAPTMKAPK